MPHPIGTTSEKPRANSDLRAGAQVSSESRRSIPLTIAGGAILIFGLVRGAAAGDGAVGIWLAAALIPLAGAGIISARRIGAKKDLRLRHCLVGAFGALAAVVVASAAFDARLSAALLGAGIVGAAAASMLVAGLKGRRAAAPNRAAERAAPSEVQSVTRLTTAKERGRWLVAQRPDDEISVVYLPEGEYVGTLDYDHDGGERGPFRAQIVKQEGRVAVVQVFVPGVVGGYITDLRSADGESGLSFPDRLGLTEGLGTNAPGYFVVADTQRRDTEP